MCVNTSLRGMKCSFGEAAGAGHFHNPLYHDGAFDLYFPLDVDQLLHLHRPVDEDRHLHHALHLHHVLDHPLHEHRHLHHPLHLHLHHALYLHRHLHLHHPLHLNLHHALHLHDPLHLHWHLHPPLHHHLALHEDRHLHALLALFRLCQRPRSRLHSPHQRRELFSRGCIGGVNFEYGGEAEEGGAEEGVLRLELLEGGGVEGVLLREEVDELPELGGVIGLPAQLGEVVDRLPAVSALFTHYQIIFKCSTYFPHPPSLRYSSPLSASSNSRDFLGNAGGLSGRAGLKLQQLILRVFYLLLEGMLEENAKSESCDEGEEGFQTLSQKMQRLIAHGLTVKSLASLQLGQSEEGPSTISAAELTVPAPSHPAQRLPLPPKHLKKTRREQQPAALKQTGRWPPGKESYSLEDGRMFELTEVRAGRQAMVSEVRHMKVREFSGRGLLVFPNGKKFEGEWVDGLLIGRAKISHSNGDTYLGDTYNFERHGRGTLLYATGEKYEGEFSSGDFHGEGTLYDPQGKVIYEGEWRRGKKHDR